MTARAEARLWQLISAAAPVGAFHYSQGLESAIDRRWVADVAGLRQWLTAHLMLVLARLDMPVISRVMDAWREGNEARVHDLDALAIACREAREVRDEQRQMGHAIGRLARGLEEPYPARDLGYTVAFGVLAANRAVPCRSALAGFAFAWCENQIVAAQKLMPIGQIAGQQLLTELVGHLDQAVAEALDCDYDAIGLCIPHASIASALHETQYSRLFRS